MANLDSFLQKDTELNLDAIYEGTWSAMTLNGSIYGVSEYVNPNGLIWFNKTMYDEAGLEYRSRPNAGALGASRCCERMRKSSPG